MTNRLAIRNMDGHSSNSHYEEVDFGSGALPAAVLTSVFSNGRRLTNRSDWKAEGAVIVA
jgi:hypothetical protein